VFSAVARIFRTPDLRKKIGFTLGIIARKTTYLPTAETTRLYERFPGRIRKTTAEVRSVHPQSARFFAA
jgi:hypothetical protein